MRSRHLKALFRRYGLLFLISIIIGGFFGLGVGVLIPSPAPSSPVFEGELVARVIDDAHALKVGTEIFRNTTDSVEVLWQFPGWNDSGGQVGTLSKVLERSIERYGESQNNLTSSLSSTTAEVFFSRDIPQVIQLQVWGQSEEKIAASLAVLNQAVEEFERDLFETDGRRQLIGSNFVEAEVILPDEIEVIRNWKNRILEQLPQYSLPGAEISKWRLELESAVERAMMDDFSGMDSHQGSTLTVSFSEQFPDNLRIHIRGNSAEDVSTGLESIAAIIELASLADQSLEHSNQVFVSDTGEVRLIESGISNFENGPIYVLSGIVLGFLYALTYSMFSLQQSRVLWKAEELHDLVAETPIVVTPFSSFAPGDSTPKFGFDEVGSLRTFIVAQEFRVIGLTSPKSVDQCEIGGPLAKSIAALSNHVLCVDATGAGFGLGDFDEKREAPTQHSALFGNFMDADPSSFVTADGVDFICLSAGVRESPDFYLSERWNSALEWARKHYDYVVVVMGSVLGSRGGIESALSVRNVFLVLRPGETRRQDLATSFTQLRNSAVSSVTIDVLGVPEMEADEWYFKLR